MITASRWLAGMSCLVLLAGCKSAQDFREDRVEGVGRTITTIGERVQLQPGEVLTLDMCKKFALENNLDIRVMELKSRVSDQRVKAEMLNMLPDFTVSNNWTDRSNYAGSTSAGIGGGTSGDKGYTRSSDKDENRFNIELAFSVLDFGLAFLNAQQAEGRALIDQEQTRRAAQNLQLDVTRAFFKVAATQDAIETTQQLLEKCSNISKLLADLAQTNQLDPFRLLDEQKRFVRLEKQLMDYRRNYQDACIELRALMGLMPTNDIRVDTAILDDLVVLEVPDVDVLEKIALAERPELYQLDIQTHITTTESRKTVLKMFPQISAMANLTNSNNPFLLNETWMEIGAKAAYNLMKLPQQIAEYKALQKEVDENAVRTLALSVGVMSQVRIAHANMREIEERYLLDKRQFENYQRGVEMASGKAATGGALTQLELEATRMEAVQSRIDCLLTLGSYYVAYARLLNAVGIDDFRPETVAAIQHEIQLAESRAAAADSVQRLQQAALVFEENTSTFNGVPLHDNTMKDGMRQVISDLLPPLAATEAQPTL